jgi:hypothetical protein
MAASGSGKGEDPSETHRPARVFLYAERRRGLVAQPALDEAAMLQRRRRQQPSAQLLPRPLELRHLLAIFGELCPGGIGSGGGAVVPSEAELEVYHVASGARLDGLIRAGSLDVVREGDCLLLRGGGRGDEGGVQAIEGYRAPLRTVNVTLELSDVVSIDASAQSYVCGLTVTASWVEPRSSEGGWSPDLALANSTQPLQRVSRGIAARPLTEDKERGARAQAQADGEGQEVVTEVWQMRGEVHSPMELAVYPRDTQRLCLELVARPADGADGPTITLQPAGPRPPPPRLPPGWRLLRGLEPIDSVAASASAEEEAEVESAAKMRKKAIARATRVQFGLRVRRRPHFHVWVLALPMCGLGALAWLSFLQPRSEFGARLATNLTLLFMGGGLALRADGSGLLPRGLLTPLHCFVLAHLVWHGAILATHAALVALDSQAIAPRPPEGQMSFAQAKAYREALARAQSFAVSDMSSPRSSAPAATPRQRCCLECPIDEERCATSPQTWGAAAERGFLVAGGAVWLLMHAVAVLWLWRQPSDDDTGPPSVVSRGAVPRNDGAAASMAPTAPPTQRRGRPAKVFMQRAEFLARAHAHADSPPTGTPHRTLRARHRTTSESARSHDSEPTQSAQGRRMFKQRWPNVPAKAHA